MRDKDGGNTIFALVQKKRAERAASTNNNMAFSKGDKKKKKDEDEEEESSSEEDSSEEEEETSEEETSESGEEETSEEEDSSEAESSEATSESGEEEESEEEEETSESGEEESEEEETSESGEDEEETSEEDDDSDEDEEETSEEESSEAETSEAETSEAETSEAETSEAETSEAESKDDDDIDDDDSDEEEESGSEEDSSEAASSSAADEESDSDEASDSSSEGESSSAAGTEEEKEEVKSKSTSKSRGGKPGAYTAVGDEDELIDKLPKEGTDLEELKDAELANAKMKNVVVPVDVGAESKHAHREWVALEEDFYNLVFLYNRSKVLFFALFFILCQYGICAMYFYDLGFQDVENGRFGIPAQVPLEVSWAQFVALPLAIMSHKECRASWNQLFMIYTPPKHRRKAKKRGWVGTMFFRVITGLLLVTVSFLLILNAETVPRVFLNLQTVVLVGMVDDVAYWLAQRGFLGKKMERATDAVPITKMPTRSSRIALAVKIVSVLIIWITMIVLWAVVFSQQSKGVFLLEDSCKLWQSKFSDWPVPIDEFALSANLDPSAETSSTFFLDSEVEYADTDLFKYFPGTAIGGQYNWVNKTSIPLDYSYISGVYKVSTLDNGKPELINQRLIYYEDHNGDGSVDQNDPTAGRFSYCEEGQAWIYTMEAISSRLPSRENDEDCPGWLLRSPSTDAYSLDGVSDVDGWRVWTGSEVLNADGDFVLDCANCKDTSDCNFHGECTWDDDSSDYTCACDDDFGGVTCQYNVPCDGFSISASNTGIFEEADTILPLGSYSVVGLDGQKASRNDADILRINGRPLYTQPQATGCPFGDDLHQVGFFFFASGRWHHGSWKGTDFCSYAGEQYFPSHAVWGGLLSSPLHFSSEPTRLGSPAVSNTPRSLGWAAYFGPDPVDVELSFQCI